MPTRVYEVNGIITAITVKVKSIYRFGIKESCIIRGNKSTRFRAVVSCVEIVELGVLVVVISSITNGVSVGKLKVGGCAFDRTVTPSVVLIFNNLCSGSIVDSNNVTLSTRQTYICRFGYGFFSISLNFLIIFLHPALNKYIL